MPYKTTTDSLPSPADSSHQLSTVMKLTSNDPLRASSTHSKKSIGRSSSFFPRNVTSSSNSNNDSLCSLNDSRPVVCPTRNRPPPRSKSSTSATSTTSTLTNASIDSCVSSSCSSSNSSSHDNNGILDPPAKSNAKLSSIPLTPSWFDKRNQNQMEDSMSKLQNALDRMQSQKNSLKEKLSYFGELSKARMELDNLKGACVSMKTVKVLQADYIHTMNILNALQQLECDLYDGTSPKHVNKSIHELVSMPKENGTLKQSPSSSSLASLASTKSKAAESQQQVLLQEIEKGDWIPNDTDAAENMLLRVVHKSSGSLSSKSNHKKSSNALRGFWPSSTSSFASTSTVSSVASSSHIHAMSRSTSSQSSMHKNNKMSRSRANLLARALNSSSSNPRSMSKISSNNEEENQMANAGGKNATWGNVGKSNTSRMMRSSSNESASSGGLLQGQGSMRRFFTPHNISET